jgi:hypothetical protein
LLLDELNASMEVGGSCIFEVQCPIQAVENREERSDGVRDRVIAIVLLLADGAFPSVIELGLHASDAVEQFLLLALQRFDFGFEFGRSFDLAGGAFQINGCGFGSCVLLCHFLRFKPQGLKPNAFAFGGTAEAVT